MAPVAVIVTLAVTLTSPSTLAGPIEPDAEGGSTGVDREVVLYYFHGARRCNTCRSIEAFAQQAVEGKFGDALESGALQWKVVNVDEPANEHYLTDFNLVGSSLVLVEMKGEEVARHEVLQEVWTLVRDEPRFVEYVQRSVDEYLK
jgi:hypothetical protein